MALRRIITLIACLTGFAPFAWGQTGGWENTKGFHLLEADGGRLLMQDALADHTTIWDTLSAVLPVDGPGGSLLLAFRSPRDYNLLEVARESGTGRIRVRMVYRKYGYDRVWFETTSESIPAGNSVRVTVERSPLVDPEDWRPWKIVLADPATGDEILRQGIDNTYPVFGMGRTGMFLPAHIRPADAGYKLSKTPRTNRAGDLTLAPLFSDGMVLQRDRTNTVWGTYLPGGIVGISLAGTDYRAVADSDGRWSVDAAPLAAGEGYELTVRTVTDTLVIENVAAGEVWLAAGQSNMEMRTWQTDVSTLSGQRDGIRFFLQPKWHSDSGEYDTGGMWVDADSTVAPGVSAVGLAFSVALRDSLKVPVGIIQSVWGGTAVESWMPREVLAEDSLCRPVLERYNASLDQLERGLPTETEFPWCWDVAGQANAPGNIFNAMVRPHIPYGIRGVVWYQGESNASKVRQYGRLFPMMIETWRGLWDMPSMPFHYVQVAGYDGGQSGAEIPDAWPYLRDEQCRVMDIIPGTCMTVAFHLGDSLDIHPYTKLTLGTRLAGSVLNRVYGFCRVPASGPLFESAVESGGSLVITFKETGAGLRTADGKAPSGFMIAGADGNFLEAEAVFGDDARSVILRTDGIIAPVFVRYGWENYPSKANLVNSYGLPASPFRTDDLILATHYNL